VNSRAEATFCLALALVQAAATHQYQHDAQQAQECSEAAIALSVEQGFPYWLAWGTILRGWALAEQGSCDEGIAQMLEGLTAYQATGAEFGRPYFMALLAEAYANAGQAQAGLDVLAEALSIVGNTGERFYEAELHRLKGELLLRRSSAQSCPPTAKLPKRLFIMQS
jgi:predicted ATPase